MDIFEAGTKLGVRFLTTKGKLLIEDLWNVPLENAEVSLYTIATGINKEIKEADTEDLGSLFHRADKPDSVLELKFNIVKHIIEFRFAEIEDKKNETERKLKKEKIMSLIAEKRDDIDKGKSIKSLEKMLADL